MILPDVNVLVSAFRPDASHHALCRTWLDGVLNGDSRYVLSRVVRITTHPRVFVPPTPLTETLRFCEFPMEQPNCVIHPGPRHWKIFSRVCSEADVRGNLVPDAWYATLAIESGCEWVTLDRDSPALRNCSGGLRPDCS